ncbi:unnamed protein product [Somion occarium]|uniref:Uncharacterized protein n=1 Tax=Somion occarium TaxID=3059160 RepID=A0ABP1DFG6_9APHY
MLRQAIFSMKGCIPSLPRDLCIHFECQPTVRISTRDGVTSAIVIPPTAKHTSTRAFANYLYLQSDDYPETYSSKTQSTIWNHAERLQAGPAIHCLIATFNLSVDVCHH